MQSMSSCAPFVYVTACENAVARSDLRTIAQCFGASQVQHHRAFYSRKEPNLLLDFYSLKAKKKPCNHWNYRVFNGASDVTRTHDLLITNQLLYQLSYTSTFLTACTFYHMSPWMSTKKFDDYYLFSCMKKCRIPAQAVDFFRFLSVVQNLHCYTTPKNTRCFRLSRPRRRSKFLHFRDNVFT